MAPQRAVDDFDSDDFVDEYDADDYGEEEELSPEDQASMEKGTADVKKALGTESKKVTLRQIQDALWDYYYDVDKSVSHLRKTVIGPASKATAKKTTPEGTSRASSFGAAHHFLRGGISWPAGADHEHLGSYGIGGAGAETRPLFHSSSYSFRKAPPALDFSDMPWGNVPSHRQAVFVEPPRPSVGLLGGGDGAPKMSKLQALAAARKKKNDVKKDQEPAQTTKHMQKLSLSESGQKENERPGTVKRQKTAASTSPDKPEDVSPSAQPHQDTEHPDKCSFLDHNDLQRSHISSQDVQITSQAAAPSSFAKTLFGSAPEGSRSSRADVYSMPYTSSSSFSASAFSEPSPDDVVMAAQAKAGKKATPAKPAAKSGQKDKATSAQDSDLSSSVTNLKVSDIPPPKNKGLDVIKEFETSDTKRSVSFVVVGHVDAGKSTLMGRLLVELRFVEERTVDKYRRLAEKSGKQSFALAWVMDQRSEERDRGVTIDIATNHFETPTTKFTILDAPGHRDFVPNMIAGASQADFAILVIDANTGAYEKGLKGQTREHVLLLRSLGVQRLIIAVNKLDMVSWSKDRFDEISQEVTGFLTGLGFQSKHISFIPISGLEGINIAKKIEDPSASWYTGPTLIEALESSEPTAARALKKPLRMGISEVFRSQQGTTTLAGKIDAGTMQAGDVVFVQPSGETAYIKSIMVDNESQDWAVAGQNITIALTDIDAIHIRIGDILCHTTDPIECGDTFTMKAMAFEHLMPMPVDLHRGRLHAPGQIESMSATLDKATGEVIKKKPKVVQPGAVARVKIKLDSKVPLERGQRVVVRSQGETIAAGLLE